MRCKKGDLAMNIGGVPSARGEIYKVIRRFPYELVRGEGPSWYVFHKGEEWHCLDKHLRPIRDNPGADETLTWTPVPSKLKEKA